LPKPKSLRFLRVNLRCSTQNGPSEKNTPVGYRRLSLAMERTISTSTEEVLEKHPVSQSRNCLEHERSCCHCCLPWARRIQCIHIYYSFKINVILFFKLYLGVESNSSWFKSGWIFHLFHALFVTKPSHALIIICTGQMVELPITQLLSTSRLEVSM
jgi:hypothetical protein